MAKALYTEHFGLRDAPFSIAPDPHFLYLSEQHRDALAHLLYGVSEAGGFVLLTGEVGTGKTTVCRCLLQQLPEEVDIAFVFNPRQSADELLHSICQELQIDCDSDKGSKYYTDRLIRWLLENHARGRRAVLIIDEAQNLTTDVLEQIRLLTNLETDDHKLLQLILLGQPELRDKLAQPELRQLAQRITARYHLAALDPHETASYVSHRLEVAGRKQAIFPPWAMRMIHRASGGIPRRINVLCDRVLLGLYAENKFEPTRQTLKKAASEIDSPLSLPNRDHRWRAPRRALLLLALLTGIVLWFLFGGYLDRSREPGATAAEAVHPAVARTLSVGEFASDFGTVLGELVRWHDASASRSAKSCEQISSAQLHCLHAQGSLEFLVSLNRPAVLEIATEEGAAFVLLRSITAGQFELSLGGRQGLIDPQDIESVWRRRFTVLSSYPADSFSTLPGVGDSGQEVDWVNDELHELYDLPQSEPELELSWYRDADADDSALGDVWTYLLDRVARVEPRKTETVFDAKMVSLLRKAQGDLALTIQDGIEPDLLMRLEAATDPRLPRLYQG